jgi:hypothetical protein
MACLGQREERQRRWRQRHPGAEKRDRERERARAREREQEQGTHIVGAGVGVTAAGEGLAALGVVLQPGGARGAVRGRAGGGRLGGTQGDDDDDDGGGDGGDDDDDGWLSWLHKKSRPCSHPCHYSLLIMVSSPPAPPLLASHGVSRRRGLGTRSRWPCPGSSSTATAHRPKHHVSLRTWAKTPSDNDTLSWWCISGEQALGVVGRATQGTRHHVISAHGARHQKAVKPVCQSEPS